MSSHEDLTPAVHAGWRDYQLALTNALRPLDAYQLALRSAPNLRSVGEIARHMIGARARWFQPLLQEGGEQFAKLGKWDRRGAPERTAEELVHRLEVTWQGMQQAMAKWTPEQWQQTFPGEDASEPGTITMHWVIWHLIEHDLHHGGEISITLGMHGVPAVNL